MVELTALEFLAPISMFVLIFVVVYAILVKTKVLGENNAINATVGVILALIFSIVTDTRDFAQDVIPWFAVLLVILFLFMLLFGLATGKVELKSWFVWVFVGIFALIIVVSAFSAFAGNIVPYVSGDDNCHVSYNGHYTDYCDDSDLDPTILKLRDWLFEDDIAGAILLIIITTIVIAIVVKK
ncbi:MAG: hypothetical protein KKF56_00800 [Nanoarchaeota archaeon]|nr:hypothetical protein [Nanoarchaeota archaeon]